MAASGTSRADSARDAPSDLRPALETQRHRDLIDRLDLIAREIEASNQLLRRILEQSGATQMRGAADRVDQRLRAVDDMAERGQDPE